ncbi:MAG: T9SS type A sorting domain-containing protein [candidate division WOR-3 bacterium]
MGFIHLNGQWFEQFIYLPDSFGGFNPWGNAYMIWDSLDDRLYLFSRDANGVIIDCRTDEKIGNPFVKNSVLEDYYSLCYNTITNCIYGLYLDSVVFNTFFYSIVAFDCASNRVISEIPVQSRDKFFSPLFNSINNRAYFLKLEGTLLIIDGWSNQLIDEVRIGTFCNQAIWNPNNDLLYLFMEKRMILAFDCNTNQIIDTIITDPFKTNILPLFLDRVRNKIIFLGEYPRKNEWNIFILDCANNQITDTIPSPVGLGYPCFWDFNPITNKLYGGSNVIYGVDLNRRTVDTIQTGKRFGKILCNPSTNQVIGFSNCLVIIDCNNNQVVDTIPYGIYPPDPVILYSIFLHPIYNKLYFPCEPCHLAVLDVSVNNLGRYKKMIKLSVPVIDFLWNPLTNRLYCSNQQEPEIFVIDGATNRHRDIIDLRPHLSCYYVGVGDLEVATRMNKIYASCGGGYFVAIDGNTDSVIRVITQLPDDMYLAYNPNNNKLYGSLKVGPPHATTYIFDCSTDVIIGEINTTSSTRPYINQLTNKVYLTRSYAPRQTFIVDGAGDTVIKVLDSIGGDIAFRHQDNRVYIAGLESYAPCITVLDGWTDTIIAQISHRPNFRIYALAYDSIDDRIYCSVSRDSSLPSGIWVLDCQTNRFIDSIPDTLHWPLSGKPILFWNPLNNKLYYECYSRSVGINGGSLIGVIDCRTNQKIAQFPQIPDACRPIAWNSSENRLYVNSGGKSKMGVIRDFPSGIEEGRFDFTLEPKLEVSQPNPFSKRTVIRYQIARRAMISLKVYDTGGKLIKVLKENIENPGEYSLIWDGTDSNNNPLTSGIYFLRFKTKGYGVTRKIILAR